MGGEEGNAEEETNEVFTNEVYTNDPEADAAPMSVLPPPKTSGRRTCRFAADCLQLSNQAHCENFSHPGDEDLDVSREGDQHTGTKYPRRQCRNHPGCIRRWTCFFSHGLVHAVAEESSTEGPTTCFLGQSPHNLDCHKPTWNGKPYEFCSAECRQKAAETPKGSLGCRRHDCPCPCTVSGIGGQFCCDVCFQGTACRQAVHTLPSSHLVVVPVPQPGKYAPCARIDCACAVDEGSTWDGNAGEFCCRACRNGTPCTFLRHTVPESVAVQAAEIDHPIFECALEGCTEPTWNGWEGEYCCLEHRYMGLGNDVGDGPMDPNDAEEEPEVPEAKAPKFPDYTTLQQMATDWIHKHGKGAMSGEVTNVWWNESLDCPGCPARKTFEAAASKARLRWTGGWRRGEFGWHGTKSIANIQHICWSNWHPSYRRGQVYCPGEYFSRGTRSGLHYSEGYAGGDAAGVLVVAWIMSYWNGAAPRSPSVNGSCRYFATGHIVCNNPTSGERMYCVPVAVVSFGHHGTKPVFNLESYDFLAVSPAKVSKPGGWGSVVCSVQ